jgi:hypothetical protein
MGTMTFQVPAGQPGDAARELERACLAGGPDNMPWPTELRTAPSVLSVSRSVDESGFLMAPWMIDGVGRVMGGTATLMERSRPYQLLLELARGKVNQVRCQAHDWRTGGLLIDAALAQAIQDAGRAFGRAVVQPAAPAGDRHAQQALDLAYRAGDQLVQAYIDQVFQIRHQRQPRLDAALACRLGNFPLPQPIKDELTPAFNTAMLRMAWSSIEAEETVYRWGEVDAALEWAQSEGFQVTAGPLIDFSSAQLPAWLWLWERDLPSLATFMCRFVEAAVRRYRTRIRRWQLTAGSNWAHVLSLGEDELLGLTYRLTETARQVEPTLELVVGVAQPWGEYMATTERNHSPFIFADHLIRSGLTLAGLDVEVVMGVTPRGSYCRDRLELSRLLDLYALLGVPLQVTMGYPSSEKSDPDADPDLRVGAGRWGGGHTPEAQADWATAYGALALCKPYVQGVVWTQASDQGPHQWPSCGLFDEQGRVKPTLKRLRELRELHLR